MSCLMWGEHCKYASQLLKEPVIQNVQINRDFPLIPYMERIWSKSIKIAPLDI